MPLPLQKQFDFGASIWLSPLERSKTTQLVYLVDQWLKAMDNRQGVMAVLMDFMKAFDRVRHNGLIYKPAALGVESQSLAWFKKVPFWSFH